MSQRASSPVSSSISITCACRENATSWSASPRKRVRIRVCRASAVRFIGTHRPSIAIENDVSTSSATAAWVRDSVSCTSTSSISMGRPEGSAARRRTPLRTVRGRSHGSLSPYCHSRVDPDRSPAAPAARQLPLALPAGHPLGDVAQQRLAELPHGLRAEPVPAVGAAVEVAAVAQRPLELLQRPGVDRGAVTELPGQRLEVEVGVEGAPTLGLRELVGELVELGEVLQHPGSVAEAESLTALELLRAAPGLTGPQRLQVGVHPGQLLGQRRRPEGLLGELRQLLPLLGGHRVEHPLGGGRALGEAVEELLDVLGTPVRPREEVSVSTHEGVEVGLGVVALLVLLEQVVEVLEHRVDGRAVLVGGVLQRVLHPGEALVEQLTSEQILDLLVRLARLAALPVVRRQLGHGRGRVGREVVELHLAQRPVSVVHLDVAGELLALLEHRPVEQLADLLQRAVEVVLSQQVATPLGHPGGRGRRAPPGRCRPGAATWASPAPGCSPPSRPARSPRRSPRSTGGASGSPPSYRP